MKIIFLDVDGVLNNEVCDGNVLDEKIDLLKQLVNVTQAKIVLSSSWRRGYKLREKANPTIRDMYEMEMLQKLERKLFEKDLEIFDYTPIISSKCRGLEITEWLELKKENSINGFVILDDMDIPPYTTHLVRVEAYIGLTEDDVKQAITILKK